MKMESSELVSVRKYPKAWSYLRLRWKESAAWVGAMCRPVATKPGFSDNISRCGLQSNENNENSKESSKMVLYLG